MLTVYEANTCVIYQVKNGKMTKTTLVRREAKPVKAKGFKTNGSHWAAK